MRDRAFNFTKAPTFLVGAAAILIMCSPTLAQSTTSQNDRPAQQESYQGSDATRRELSQFDQFLDSHREVDEQVRRNPSLLDNREFVDSHSELRSFLQDHPGIHDDIRQNSYAFMHQEERFDRQQDARDPDITRRDLGEFDRFMDSHRETAEQLRKDPSLIDNRQFVDSHPELRTFLQDHPQVRDEIRQDPNSFMHQEERFDSREDARNGETGRIPDRDRDSAEFRQFLDNHREIAEQLRRDPGHMNDDAFIRDHAELQAYLQAHPGVRQEMAANSNDFVREDNAFQSENRVDRDPAREHMANFGAFLGSHSDIARDVSNRPDVVRDRDYVDHHPEFKTYLNANPQVRNDLMANPQNFVKGAQQFNNGGAAGNGSGAPATSGPSGGGMTGGKDASGSNSNNSSNSGGGSSTSSSGGTSGGTTAAPAPTHDNKDK
jgi:hypothetical protein